MGLFATLKFCKMLARSVKFQYASGGNFKKAELDKAKFRIRSVQRGICAQDISAEKEKLSEFGA
jgi:hypothetical protein